MRLQPFTPLVLQVPARGRPVPDIDTLLARRAEVTHRTTRLAGARASRTTPWLPDPRRTSNNPPPPQDLKPSLKMHSYSSIYAMLCPSTHYNNPPLCEPLESTSPRMIAANIPHAAIPPLLMPDLADARLAPLNPTSQPPHISDPRLLLQTLRIPEAGMTANAA